MNDTLLNALDIEISRHDIQALSGSDAIAAFFARLGYNTDARTPQTAGNLGITADGTVRPIKKIELIADQEGLFQVYLFELQSVTVAHTRALARAFRNRAGNYLLILTSDYERLDFVLLEKYLPAPGVDTSGFGQRQVGIRPRILTIERLKPTPVHLRVLRRLTWTESDPFGQYDKLLSAYALADWSEEYFNNRALFSDYYLKERLPDFPVWKEDPKPSYLKLRELYHAAASRFAGKERKTLCEELIEPVLDVLGFEARPGRPRDTSSAEPHYRLTPKTGKDSLLGLCLVYPWDRSLDGKDDRRDSETSEENPGAVVVSLLEKGESSWIVVTNGRLWRLYAKRTHARATNYYEIDLDEVLSQAGPHAPELAESFRYFWLLFRSQAFEPQEIDREGKKVSLPLLDQLLVYSEDYAKELGARLKARVFEDIFPHLAAGFIASIRERDLSAARLPARGQVSADGLKADISQETLNTIYQGTLTLLYRLLFLLYAESRDLLPVKEVRGYFESSLTKLKQEVAEAAGTIEDNVEEKVKKHYRDDSYHLYDRLCRLFQIIDKGDSTLNVPVYNGGLFLSDPEEKDDSPEADAARFLNGTKVPDRFLARGIDLLARDEDRKRHDLVFIDFKSLGVRQLGSIYEGLLEFKLRIADRKLAIAKEKGREVYMPFNDLDEKDRERAERQERIKKKGQVYLENNKHERKATGSYYTPDHIVKYIVEHAVGPVLKEKFEAMRPKLREAQQKRRAFFDRQEALRKQGLRAEPEGKAEFIGQEIVDELFNIKILDPAMGSGHFLVEAVDYITDKTLDFLNAFPWNPVIAHLSRMRETILDEMDDQGITIDPKRLTDVNLLKRHVLKRCIYGVDINPMAVELAKVSLWLDCFTLGAPLSFLDHHLRCGNSLIGVTVEEVDKIRAATEQLTLSASSDWQGLLQSIQGMIEVGGLPDVTSAQVARSRSTYKFALSNLENFKKILDVHTARWFVEAQNGKGKGKKAKPKEDPFDYILKSGDLFEWSHGKKAPLLDVEPYRSLLYTSATAAKEKRFFHWELEFPEVFYGPRLGTTQAIERLDAGGFDAAIGNPPWGATFDDYDKAFTKNHFSTLASVSDSYLAFSERGLTHVQYGGLLGFILPDAWLSGIKYRVFREFVGQKNRIRHLVDLPYDVFEEAYVDCLLLVASNKVDRDSSVSVTVFGARDPVPLDWGSWNTKFLPYKDWIARIDKQLDLEITGSSIFSRIEAVSLPLGQIAEVDRGLEAYGQKTPMSVRRARGYHSTKSPSQEGWMSQFTGELRRYELDHGEPLYVKLGPHLAECPSIRFFTEDRILLRRLISRQFRLMACEVKNDKFANDSSTLNLIRFTGYAPTYVLALLNSSLFSYRLLSGSSIARRDDYPKISLYEAKTFPICKIEFITPKSERLKRLTQLTDQYCLSLRQPARIFKTSPVSTGAFSEILALVGNCGQTPHVPVDVVHDFLADLAGRITEMHREKQVETKRFLIWLEKELKIRAENDKGVEALTGKTTLKSYLGDYQKREDHVPFEVLWEVLKKNSNRLRRTLDKAFEDAMCWLSH
ncbi:MAG: N-6 DNA methylase [Deltaproteobacteria bacterium]|nr:N-6 DNA methylase [Deltaproteobacteria bacterium]